MPTSAEFQEWPVHYAFPPFFTLQPNKETQTKQRTIWIKLIKDYCEKRREFILEIGHPLFSNKDISRTLSPDAVQVIFEEMVKTSEGEYLTPTAKDRIYVWWQSKETWAKALLEHAGKNGLLNSVATIYELLNENEEFQGMDEPILVKILNVLQSQGKCELMFGNNSKVDGVKFFM